MKFSGKNWLCGGGREHLVIQVEFNEDDIKLAEATADSKLLHVNAHTPGGVRRPLEVIRNRIIAGKLADAAILGLMQRRIDKSGLGGQITVREYDLIRSDSFENPDPYDLDLHRAGRDSIETIEVRSSFCYRLAPVERLIQVFSIYGWYTSFNKPAEPPRDWYWQIVYYLRPQDVQSHVGPTVAVFEEQLAAGCVTGYVVGGASQQLLNTAGGTRKDQDGAFYRAISPICSGFDYWEMMDLMLGSQNR